jgi:hypothetical protein
LPHLSFKASYNPDLVPLLNYHRAYRGIRLVEYEDTMSYERKGSTASVMSGGRRRSTVGEQAVTSVLTSNEVPIFDRELTADEQVLAALGYK